MANIKTGRKISLPIWKETAGIPIELRQGNINSIFLTVDFIGADALAVTLPPGAKPRMEWQKPDKTIVMQDGVVDPANANAFIVELTAQCFTAAGRAVADFKVADAAGNVLVGAQLSVEIGASAVNPTAITSVSEFVTLQNALSDVAYADEISQQAVIRANAAMKLIEPSTQAAAASARAARLSETNANEYAKGADSSEIAAGQSKVAAKASETSAKASETNAGASEAEAGRSKTAAAASERNAKTSENAAAGYAVRAETAAASAEAGTVPWYGVQFNGGTNPGVRTGSAIGLVFNAGTGTNIVQNDFDNIMPWAHMATHKCCCDLKANGDVVVNAYAGQPGYAVDGTKGDVFVEIPLFYIGGDINTNPKICMTRLAGYRAPKKFMNADGSLKQYAYIRAYEGSIAATGKLRSISGQLPAASKNWAQFMAAARANGETYSVETTDDYEVVLWLMIVSMGTRDAQAIMRGYSAAPYNNNYTTTIATTSGTTVTLLPAHAALFGVGQTIGIGVSIGSMSVASQRIVVAVDTAAGTITFDGAAVSVEVGAVVWSMPHSTGSCDNLAATCGSLYDNTNGRSPFVFYGIENFYANLWKFVADVKMIDGVYYACADPTLFSGTTTTGYNALDLIVPGEGYTKMLSADDRHSSALLPTVTGGSDTTFIADYFYRNTSGVRVALRGGHLVNGRPCGVAYWYFLNDFGSAGWHRGASLSAPGTRGVRGA